jgi:choline kinase
VDHKREYDDDDMKVSLDRKGQLLAIGKKLPAVTVNGESIGILAFRDVGVKWFRESLESTLRQPDALKAWYLSVVNEMAQQLPVATVSIRGLWWQEIDSVEDLDRARAAYREQRAKAPGSGDAGPPARVESP